MKNLPPKASNSPRKNRSHQRQRTAGGGRTVDALRALVTLYVCPIQHQFLCETTAPSPPHTLNKSPNSTFAGRVGEGFRHLCIQTTT